MSKTAREILKEAFESKACDGCYGKLLHWTSDCLKCENKSLWQPTDEYIDSIIEKIKAV